MEEKETLKSTRDQVEEFKNSMLWLDFKSELKRLYVNAGIEYDLVGEPHTDDSGAKIIPNSSETLIHLGEIKGRRKAVKYFLSIPDIFLQILEENKNDS